MTKVVSFGELMLRLCPPGHERFLQSPALVATFAGAEASVAVTLAAFGLESWYVTRLPANAIGDAAIHALRAEGVHTDAIVRGGDRIGVYYVEHGVSQRPGVVIDDRAHSAVSQMEPGEVDWSRALEGAAWFHVTGITPALGERAVACTRAAVRAARAAGARISLDLNFRRKLWSEAEAQAVMPPFVPDIDLLIANEEHLTGMLGIAVSNVEQACRDLGVPLVALTHRDGESASDNGVSASLWDRASQTLIHSQRYDVRLVDRLGGGDAFAGGLIYALLAGRTPEAALRFAVAAGALNQTIPGDFNRVSVAEVDRLAAGDGSGRVRR